MTNSWFGLVDQADIWIDREGVAHTIATMDVDYCRRLLVWLWDRAAFIVTEMNSAALPDTDTLAYDSIVFNGGEEDEMLHDPHAWLVDSPLITALRIRAGWLPPTALDHARP
ncbi:hypothetical protein [Streptosporangium sp. NPDC002524]|uniref:hypothetical protein n=1 Tax=Streptosporangium sp. NPDC002524 TaxID=3154537 RepID=UPI0033250EDC